MKNQNLSKKRIIKNEEYRYICQYFCKEDQRWHNILPHNTSFMNLSAVVFLEHMNNNFIRNLSIIIIICK